ncbi:MAG: peptidylprolyl isomerase [Planctomycetota bacterium]
MMPSLLLSILLISPFQEPAAATAPTPVSATGTQETATEVSHEERVKRAYVYSVGKRYILQRTLDELLLDEIQLRKEAETFVGDVEISPEEIQAEVDKRLAAVKAQDATLDFWQQVRAQGFTEQTFRQELRRSLQMRNMFFPADPEMWPVARLEEVLGEQWKQFMLKNHQDMIALKKEGKDPGEVPEQTMNMILRPTIWSHLIGQAEIVYPSDGLPEGVVLRVNGREVKTEDALAVIQPFLGETDKQLAEAFVLRLEIAEAALKASGSWLSDEEYQALYDAEAAEFEGSIIPHEMLVTQFLGFPTMELYKDFFRARKSFRSTLPADGSDEYKAMQKKQIAERGTFFGNGKVKVDIILISARDTSTGKFPLTGDPYTGAEERAMEVAQILADGSDFSDVLLEYSDYPESVAGSQAGMTQPDRGRFPMLSRNDLRNFLGESDYVDFLIGYSITDDIFFHAEPGAIYGPVRGSLGYYIYRVESRQAPTKEVPTEGDERTMYTVNDDLLTANFFAFVNKLLN